MLLAAWYHPILATLFALVAVFLMMVILLQRGRGVGLAGAFGGAGGNTAFGSKTGDVLTWATVVIACVFLLLTVVLNFVFVPETAGLGGVPAIGASTQQPASEAIDPGTDAPDLAEALNSVAETTPVSAAENPANDAPGEAAPDSTTAPEPSPDDDTP
jgi:preprotein translocase subunit SecG